MKKTVVMFLIVVLLVMAPMTALADSPIPIPSRESGPVPQEILDLLQKEQTKSLQGGGGYEPCVIEWVAINAPNDVTQNQPAVVSFDISAKDCDPARVMIMLATEQVQYTFSLASYPSYFNTPNGFGFSWPTPGEKFIYIAASYAGRTVVNFSKIFVHPQPLAFSLLGDYSLNCVEGQECVLWIQSNRPLTLAETQEGVPVALKWSHNGNFQIVFVHQQLTQYKWVYEDYYVGKFCTYVDLWTIGMGWDWQFVCMADNDQPINSCPIPPTPTPVISPSPIPVTPTPTLPNSTPVPIPTQRLITPVATPQK